MDKKIKVLFISSWFPNRIYPTNGDFVERHAQSSAIHNEVAVLHVQADPAKKSRHFELQEKGTNPYILLIYFKKNTLPLLSKVINSFFYLRAYLYGFRFILKKSGRPDIIHANIIFPVTIIACLIKWFFHIPFVLSEHWTIYLSDHIPFKRLSRFLVRKAGMIMPVSGDLETALKRHGFSGRYQVVPNAVDISRFTMKSHATGILRFIHVSSMKEEHKNILGILHAASRLDKVRQNFRIDFIGSSTDRQIEEAEKLGLLNRVVFFHGKQPHETIPSFMQEADVFLMFSNYENQPCVIAESFSCGLPVLSSNTGGIYEHVDNNTGCLVKTGDEDDLLRGMIYMTDHYAEFDRAYIQRYAVQHFSMEAVGRKFTECYGKVLNTTTGT